MNFDFLSPLPRKFRKADHRAKNSLKHYVHSLAAGYWGLFNEARIDRIQLHPLPDFGLVTRITIVQRITLKGQHGNVHYFKFYGGKEFFLEIRLGGKRVMITSHLLDQFCERFPGNPGAGLTDLLAILFAHPWMTAMVNGGEALITPYEETFFAFPFEESGTEFLLKTCLTVNQINSFAKLLPPIVYNHHYSAKYSPPINRHWSPEMVMELCYRAWISRITMKPTAKPLPKGKTWASVANLIVDEFKREILGVNTRFVFMDNIPGPVPILVS